MNLPRQRLLVDSVSTSMGFFFHMTLNKLQDKWARILFPLPDILVINHPIYSCFKHRPWSNLEFIVKTRRDVVCICVYALMQTFRKLWNLHDLQCNFLMLKQQFSAKDMPSLIQNLISVFLNLGLEYSFVLLNYLLVRSEVFHLSEPLLPICKRQEQRALPFCVRCMSICILNQSSSSWEWLLRCDGQLSKRED